MIVLLLSGSIGLLNAQNVKEKAILDNTEQFYLSSKYVQGENYKIQVGLPNGYYSSQKSYPVVYVLDGDVVFGMTKEITGLLMLGNEIKDILVVGISYGKGIDDWWNKRQRDYLPDKDTLQGKYFPYSGGTDNFIKFLQYELFPVINKNYRTIPDSSTLSGESGAGLLGSLILFTHPELFKNYIIIEPSLWWNHLNNKSMLNLESEYYSHHKELNKTVYLVYGIEGDIDHAENMEKTANELIQRLQSRNYQGLKLVTRIFDEETHYSIYSTAFTNGLKAIFKL
jgi:predicted alpha/beta superfamily hydrolase